MAYYNSRIFFLFLGGIFSLILTVVVIYARQQHKRQLERQRLEDEKKRNPEAVGDLEQKLNDTAGYEKVNVFEVSAKWAIQPLLIISFVGLLDQSSTIEICGAFFLMVLTILHEFYSAEQHSKKWGYQVFIALLWVFFFAMISYKANLKELAHKQLDIQQNNHGQTAQPPFTDTSHPN